MKAVQIQHFSSLLCKNKILVEEGKPRRMTPSVFTQEMLQSTEERLCNTTEVHLPLMLKTPESNTLHHTLSPIKPDRPIFQPYPSELVFQNFIPLQTYSLPLLLLNNDKVAHAVKLERDISEQFYVVGPENGSSKVAPGMTLSFTVFFTPQESKDYSHRLVCVTPRERFEIPIRAIGPRGILDFRDEIHLPLCLVKASTEKTHFVCNVGNCKAKFKLHTQSPFSVTPSSGTLSVGEGIQVTVVFHPMTVGDFQEDLLLHYGTGEDVHISLFGTSQELDICLEPEPLKLKKTYISLASSQIVSLTNCSEIPLQYHWTVWPSQAKDDLENSVLQQGEEKKEENMCQPIQCGSDPTAIHHLPLLSRALQESESRAAEDCLPTLSLSGITLEPAEGEIWPNTTANFIIIFKPEEAKVYQHTVYCDVTGSESPLPLRIKGEGLGPKLKLNYNLMDMKNVFIGDKDHYEVQMTNRGLIDAPFRFSRPDTTFGRCFSINPEEGVVPPGICQAVGVTFHSQILGSFSEDLLLTVTGQSQPLTLTFRGCVIGPTFHFNVYELNFGDVAFGFPATQTCTLFNTSFVPMTFALHVMGDGLGSASVSSAKQVSDLSQRIWQGYVARDPRLRPVEFTVCPAAGTVDAMSNVTIKVTLCSNTAKKYELALAVDVEGVGEEVMVLPLNARCVVPEIVAEPAVLDFQRCYLDLPYEQNVRLINSSSLPACYGMLDQEIEESTTVLFGSSVPRGVLPPGSSKEIPVFIAARAVGRIQNSLRIAVFGSLQQPLEVVLSCIGEGPNVYVPIAQLKFGSIPVLTDVTRTLQLLNQSPIPAHFNTCMIHKQSFWRVEPSEGEVPPESQLELKIVAHLNDTRRFLDKLEISVRDSRTHVVSLSATGTGTTIVSDKPLGPNLDLGTHFCNVSYQYPFKLTNHGPRHHRMFWKIGGFLASPKQHVNFSGRTVLPPISSSGQRDTLRHRSLPSSNREKSVFTLSPACVDLSPGSSVDMVLAAFTDSPKIVHERLVCDSIIGGHGCQETIMSVEMMCRFVAPLLSISSKQLNFYVKKVKGDSLLPVYQKLVLYNVSSLSLSMELILTEPFFLCETPGDPGRHRTKFFVLEDQRQSEFWVCFDPSLYKDLAPRIVDETLKINYLEHPQQDIVKLHAVVHFPNLHFSSTTVDFGCVQNCTETKKTVTITNCSPLPLSYCWAFLEDQNQTQLRLTADDQSTTQRPVHVEEAFDISPMYGVLQPQDQQLVTFYFFGHENISRAVVAQCSVEDGPTYDVQVRGEASAICYSLESTHLDFGSQLFHCVGEVEMCVRNSGKVGFEFSIIQLPSAEEDEGFDEDEGAPMKAGNEGRDTQQLKGNSKQQERPRIRPGLPKVIPAVGYIGAGSERHLRVLYLPGIPEVFEKHFQLQVAFLPPQEITLTGVGVIPRIRLNLPRNLSEECYSDVLQQAQAAVEAQRVRQELEHGILVGRGPQEPADCAPTYEELIHLEVERLLVIENALRVPDRMLELSDQPSSLSQWQNLSKVKLPEYVLDFGLVIPGKVYSQMVNIINNGSIPVSFYAHCKHLTGTGFTTEFESVQNLPCGETQTFTIEFDFHSPNGKTGQTSIILPIQLTDGPVVQVKLCAVITMPTLTVSKDMLLFDTVQCGMCQIQTIQLQNCESVPCQWSMAEEVKPLKKQQRLIPAVFQMIPCSGVMFPGERVNVHIKFCPVEGCSYSRRLVIHVSDSTQQVFITARGQAEEARLEFCPSVLELGPCLPFSSESKAEVTVKNHSSFPIEFYSLEFDKQYLKEEEILRLIAEYDENNMLLLPPRVPGEGFPAELLEYCSQLKDDVLNVGMVEDESKKDGTVKDEEKSKPNDGAVEMSFFNVKPGQFFFSQLTREGIIGSVKQLDMTPASRAIARHMELNLSPEGLTAQNHRGIAIIVYGAPLTDKSSMAAALACYYGAACLSIDAVVTDAIQNGTSPASQSARQLYHAAVADYEQKKAAEAAKAIEEKTQSKPAAPPESSDPDLIPAFLNTVDVPADQSENCCNNNPSTAHQTSENTAKDFCVGRNATTISFFPPEHLLVEILIERFQLSDCHSGIVINGLESVYSPSQPSTLQVVLKAISNRKHIYVLNLSDTYDALKERDRQQREAEEALQKEIAEREERWQWELDQETFDALPDEDKEKITQRHLAAFRQKKQRALEQKAKEEEERRQQEENHRLKEKELKKKKKKDEKSATLEALKTSLEIKQSIVDELQCEFDKYEQSQAMVEQVLQQWDRVQGVLLDSFPAEELRPGSDDAIIEKKAPSTKKSKKSTTKAVLRALDLIPHIVRNVTQNGCGNSTELLNNSILPTLDKILNDLSLGHGGPPSRPPTTLSVVAFPEHREQPKVYQTCFTFLNPSGHDEDDENKDLEEHAHKAIAQEKATGSKRHKGNSDHKTKDKKGKESQMSITRQSKTKSKASESLTTFRWVVPANSEVLLKIWFYSESPGIFKQVFNFELAGNHKLYQLTCRGVCTYPSISKEFKTLFAHSKKVAQEKEDLQKTYVIKPGYFEFGPLLCSKTRDRYKKNTYPENSVKLVIDNNSSLEAEVQFSFQHDTQATTYLLDPPTMALTPGQKEVLTVWAFPTKQGQIKDSLICHIKDNPEPTVIQFSCWGVRPELELEISHLSFGRILLHRRDSRGIMMHNKTPLPLSWILQGVDALGDEFMVPQDQGVIKPNSSFLLSVQFRAKRPILVKKLLRLEVYDVDKIIGILQTENIQVYAEAYDVDLKIEPAASLDFGTIRANEDAKQQLKLTNKGKYDLAFKFSVGCPDPTLPTIKSMFTVSPQSGTLLPRGKPTAVVIVCRPDKEVSLKEESILSCQVIEPSIKGGETIATLDIKISLQAVFSRYKITPAWDIDFGPLIYGTDKSQNFTIENYGHFPIHFTLSRMISELGIQARPGGRTRVLPRDSVSAKSTGSTSESRQDLPHRESSTRETCLNMGVFTLSPYTGNLQPGSQQQITVVCVAEQLGIWNQGLLIDISGRDPSDQPDGIPYRLFAEVCKPGIVVDPTSIFEEHYLCQNSSQLSSEQFCNAEGIFVLDEKRFIFNNVLVGQTARARFKLTNNNKVPCTLNLAIKYGGTKTPRQLEVFDLPATTLNISNQSHAFAVVTFTPQAIRSYSAVFEATVKGHCRSKHTFMSQTLEFQLTGKGILPSVCVLGPAGGNSTGKPVIQFGRALVGRRHTLPLVLLNDGNVVAEVQIDLVDKHDVFTIKAPADSTNDTVHLAHLQQIPASEGQLVHRATARLDVNEQKRFEVSFCSTKSVTAETTMTVQVKDNQYSNITIHVTGEAYQEIVSLDNISRSTQDGEDEVEGFYEMLNFGDCHVDCKYQESFTMTNHSSSQVVRFEWPPSEPNITFSPKVGHIHAGCSKEVTITFCFSQPVTLKQPMRCKICQVMFKQPIEEVADWDDRHKSVKWQNASDMVSEESQQPEIKKVKETDPEPLCSVVEGSQSELDLEIRAVCDYSKFSCSSNTIQLKDTMLFQTRLHQLQIINVGSVKVDFCWQVQMDSCYKISNPKQDESSGSGPGSSLSRPPSACSSVLSLLKGNPELPPFSVEPRIGTINPGATQNFSVCFSPVEVAQFQGRLLCSIPNLQNGDQAPCITVSGQGLLPNVHFDLEDSDYIRSNRHSPKFSRLLDPSTPVLEFKAIGFSAPTRRSFNVVNPTRKAYDFKWRCEDTAASPFHCLTSFGTIPSGKKVEMCFEFVAEHQETVESLWSFLIENLSLSFPFLCVGTAREPCVYLDRPHLDFGELVVGHKVEQTVDLVNAEEEPFQFSVLQLSLLSEDQQSSLTLKPMNGTVMSKNRLPLLVSFTPSLERYVHFRLNLKVKRKLEPLLLNVKADCFNMSVVVQIQEHNGSLREILPNHENTLDFGKVGISEQCTYNLLVSNLSRFILEVSFELTGDREHLQQLEVKPQAGAVEIGKQLQVSVFFCPQTVWNLQDVQLIVKVKLGPTFTFSIKGRARAPSLDFSFTKFNFGKCFLFCPGMLPPSQTLLIHNKDTMEVSVQCQFKNTGFLEVDFQPDILRPGAVMKIPIKFYPQRTSRYNGKLTFVLNDCVTKHVEIEGQGIELKLEVTDPSQKKVKLGSLMLGQRVNKQVVLVNHSLLDLSFTLTLSTNIPLDPKDLSVSPAGELKLKSGGGSCKVEIQFSPHQHIPPFSAELQAKFAGFFHPLLTIEGCCKGVEVHLDSNHLSFGAVVQHCKTSRRIVMMNTGDASARFQWQTDFPPELSIKPVKGYIGPGKDVPFEVTFAPLKPCNDLRYENLSCFIEGSPSVKLTVTGSCIQASTSKEVVNFACRVQSSQTQSLSITNPCSERCSIRPAIEGEQWSATLFLTFEPNQTKTFDITYRPLTMTPEGHKHLGSVFFSFPAGKGMLFSLQGTATPPKAKDTIMHELPAKTKHCEVLQVNNWLSRQQRFCVLLEVLKHEKTDPIVFLKGHDSIEVPALTKRDYKMSFFAYREGDYNTKVTFRNEVTGEYLFYLVNFKVRPPGVLSTIKLETPVRQMASAALNVENPLTTATSFTTECKCGDIKAPPQQTVPGQSKGVLSFEYLPLHVGESTARLTLFSSDLGHFPYNLLLKALPPPTEETVHFQAALGNSHSTPVKFINYTHLITKYQCKTDCPDFTVDKSVSASPGFPSGSEVRVEVRFEPHQLGEVKGQLSLTSETGGEYIFPLHGVCILPRPQGPFRITAGGSVTIPFKNVFCQTTTFSLQVDNPCFTVKAVNSIPSKKTQNILVSFEAPTGGPPGPWFGKMTICSQHSEDHCKPCSWVYYLKGQRPQSSLET
ncbi:hydrocephalus-inducing protein homolog isoform X6 [Girardinichthys multiradiatus]|uniref:hydrocephalus-inducing protein homolog isoform X6 n=1 Tax=Girardinichthys multiradiatus TaxID=208333 RepID=UPI001FABE656|nr:hydrocephalus-inducing protein homolog isoform X6 [Girardinichthys multiradiatus]